MQEIPIDREVAPEVSDTGLFGGDILEGGFYASLPDQPAGIPLRHIFQASGEADFAGLVARAPAPLSDVYRQFELWLIPHRVSIKRRQGLAEVTSVGIEIDHLHEGSTCNVRGLLPSFQYVVQESVQGCLLANGELRAVPDTALSNGVRDYGGIRFGLERAGSLELNFHAPVPTPHVSAFGCFTSRYEWRFDAVERPLLEPELQTWAFLALPRWRADLRFRARFFFERRAAYFSRRTESDWVELKCDLEQV
jgi:hypothetical protein